MDLLIIFFRIIAIRGTHKKKQYDVILFTNWQKEKL